MNITVLELVKAIDSAQEIYTGVIINKNGDQLDTFIIKDFYDARLAIDYKAICNSKVKSFLFTDAAITIEI